MALEYSNILKRQEQLTNWIESETNKAPKNIKKASKIQFSNEVQFLSACSSNDWQEVERLLDIGIDINSTQGDGLTALHQACIDDNEHLVKYLIDKGANIDVQDKEGWTPLFAAISCNYLPIIKYLLSCNARLDIVSYDGELPLDQTTNEVVIALIREEMKRQNLDALELRNRERNAMLSDVEYMKQTNDFSKFTLSDNGGTLLHIAASKNYTDVLENLLEIISPEQLNHTDNEGWNALHVAAHWGNKNACLLLVDADIDFDQVTANNKTVLEVSDDDARLYIREEIRKAKFRRQDRAKFKRPATSPVVEHKPSETKIICQEKSSTLSVDTIPQKSNSDEELLMSTDSISCPLSSSSSLSRDVTTPQSVTFNGTGLTNSVVDDDVNMKLNTDSVKCTGDSDPDKVMANSETSLLEPTMITVALGDVKENVIINDSQAIETDKTVIVEDTSLVVPQPKVIETESRRKDKARQNRSSRRLTQTVSAEQIDEASKTMSAMKSDVPEKISTNNKSTKDNGDERDTENRSDSKLMDVVSPKITPLIQITDKSLNGDTHKTILTEQNSNPPEVIISTSNQEFVDQTELKRKAGNHLINKRKTRERQPTGVVDAKDVLAAENEFLNKLPNNLLAHEESVDYKALYEVQLKEKEKLQRNLARMNRDLEESENKIKTLQTNSVSSKSEIESSSPCLALDCDSATIERLRDENQKMKEANSALIRVISRLSHPRSKPISNSS